MESKSNVTSINANGLKLIAIVAMTIDHVTWILLPLESAATEILHMIGRLAFPIMAYFIVEGYHHTKNIKKYLARLLILAAISHFAYAFCFNHPYFFDFSKGIVDTTSVLWGLSFGLLSLIIYHSKRFSNWLKALLIVLCIIASIPSDWSWVCVALPLVMDMNYGNFKKQMIWMVVIGWCYAFVYCFLTSWWSVYQFAIIIVAPVLYLYNGQRGKLKGMKWFFYIYYPLHLAVLGIIRAVMKA